MTWKLSCGLRVDKGVILILFALRPVCSLYLFRLCLGRLCFTTFVSTI
jgi:hypothetical protein